MKLLPLSFFLTAAALVLTGCEGSSGDWQWDWTTPATISGTWVANDFYQPDSTNWDAWVESRIVLNQNGSRVSGSQTETYESGRKSSHAVSGAYDLNTGLLTLSYRAGRLNITRYYRFGTDGHMYWIASPDNDERGFFNYIRQ